MHIKTLTIQGFKSYRDQTAVEEFSPGHNVVVGRNGSGKSNFFAAIRFVLSDAYTSMSKEERQALLHDSSASTSTTLSAFVEIVFDNADGRFPSSSGSSELALRRTIGMKKDEYSIDRKSATKSDVMNLLEAAGFSRSNPYYIVPQGRITHLTNMKDADRLTLLKDVAGTKVYETRRADSLRIMEETESKKQKIGETLTYIQDRLQELDEERQELREFHDKDKDRRSLEYTLFHRDSQDLVGKLDELDARRREELGEADDKQKQFLEREKQLKTLEDDLSNLQHRAAQQVAERDSLLEERRDLARSKAELEAQINDDEERIERMGATREELQQSLDALEARIATTEGELMGLTPSLEENVKRLNDARARLEASKARIQILFGKKGRSAQYRTQAERDAALRSEIEALQSFKQSQSARQTEVQDEVTQLTNTIAELETSLAEKATALEERRTFIEESAGQWKDVKSKEDNLLERKKELWKEESKLASSVAVAQDKLAAAQRALSGMMDRATAMGLSSVDAVAQRLGLQAGVHGPLYKLFTVAEQYKTAVEVTAGQSLFHVVVDTDETASRLVEVMTREKLGRVTFMPLNRLQPKPTEFQEKMDALVMLKKLTYQPAHKKALQQVFGQMIICPSLAVAASYVQSNGVNAITLDGDKVERKGALSGGYNDPKRSRLDAVRDLGRWQDIHTQDAERLREVRSEIQTIEQESNALASERQVLETRSKRADRSREPINEEVRSLREAESTARRRVQKLHDWREQLKRDLANAEAKLTALRDELQTPLNAGLSEAEIADLDTLNRQVDGEEKTVGGLVITVTELSTRVESLQLELDANMKRERDAVAGRLEQLQNQVIGGSQQDGMTASSAPSKADHQRRLSGLRAQMSDKQKRLERVEREVDEVQQSIKEKQDRYDALTGEQINEAREITKHEKVLSKITTLRREYEKRKAEVDQKIRELGILPGDGLQKYADDSSAKVLKQLHKIQASLKKFAHVNRRAIEQYDNFAKQRDQLLEREVDLQQSSESIQELIETLDMRKDEAIERTFKQVSKNFADVFARLVPMGRGSLIMQKRIDAESQQDEDEEMGDEDEAAARASSKRIENYIGVSIKVSFHSKVDEGLRIHQLSGGQKSLVALALIFAIQRCDPAAFYLFDEIDANLDAQYRTAVAAMIHELSANAQFITTTFRPELVGVGEKHYGVFFSAQKVSSLRPITQDEAFRFVEASAEAVQT